MLEPFPLSRASGRETPYVYFILFLNFIIFLSFYFIKRTSLIICKCHSCKWRNVFAPALPYTDNFTDITYEYKQYVEIMQML